MTVDEGGWISGSMKSPPARLSEILAELTDRQRALYWFVLAEASSIDERLMIVRVMARQIRANVADVIAVREVLLSGHYKENVP